MSEPTIPWTDAQRAARFDGWLRRIAPQHGLAPETLRLASADADRDGDADG